MQARFDRAQVDVKKKFIFEMDYRTMYHNVKSCNQIALNKFIKARRSADYWKSEHATFANFNEITRAVTIKGKEISSAILLGFKLVENMSISRT